MGSGRIIRRVARALAAPWLLMAVMGCQSGGAPRDRTTGEEPAPSHPIAPQFVRGPTGGAPIAAFVASEAKRARDTGQLVLVYVGAQWCEPCLRFHDAVESGRLDSTLAGLRFLEFDLDADGEALRTAGYASTMIPLFAVPKADGHASDLRIEGSIKGAAAVDSNIVPRLEALRARTRAR